MPSASLSARHAPLLLLAAAVLAAAAFTLDHLSRTQFGPVAAVVNVQWAAAVNEQQREALERQFALTRGKPNDEGTYVYLLTDTSSDNIRELVRHPAVRDTHHIDRGSFTLADSAAEILLSDAASQRRSRQTAAAADVLWNASGAVALTGLLVILAPSVMRRLASAVTTATAAIAAAVYSGIPAVSPRGAALFRIVFAGAVLALFVISPAGNVPPGPQPDDSPWLTRMAGAVFIAWPWLADFVDPWLLVTGALTVVGAFTRVMFPAFVCGAVAWGVIYSMQSGHHPISALLVTMLCLLPARWSDAWSIDAWVGRRRAAAAPREYGYTVWIPGVVLGVSLAGAAAAKLAAGGIGWILNGTVKYHFVTDAANAPVDWGLRFGLDPAVAVALSFGAIAVELFVLPVAVFGPPPARIAAAFAAGAMFAGFWIFQGVAWPSWWVLLLSFAPWQHVLPDGTYEAAAARVARWRPVGLARVQVACLAALFTQQLAASTWAIEVPPLISAYDMYSKTYASPEEFVRATTSRRLLVTLTDGTERSCPISEDEADDASLDPLVSRCFPDDLDNIRAVAVEATRRDVDWTAGRFRGLVRQSLRAETR